MKYPHIRDGINLLEHQAEHTETETIVMILTSSKGFNCTDNNLHFEKLSAFIADDSFTPLKDKTVSLFWIVMVIYSLILIKEVKTLLF